MNKNIERIIRLGVLLLMVLFGLTAVFPEWLDFKDMILANHQLAENDSSNDSTLISIETINSIRNIPSSTLSFINHGIIGVILPVDFPSYGIFAIIDYALWLLLALVMYALFFTLCLLIFLFTGYVIRKRFNVPIITLIYPKIILVIRLSLSVGFAFIVWPVLVNAVVMVFRYTSLMNGN